ncbi:MAG: hypothetical protein ACRC10_05550 [Thermoguttaceae bacterium]
MEDGRIVYRVVASKSFGTVKKGQKGGFLQSMENLDQYGNCWVAGNAVVAGNATVTGNAIVGKNAFVDDYGKVADNAYVGGQAQLLGDCFVCENAKVGGFTILDEAAEVSGNARVNCSPRRTVSKKNVLPNINGNGMVTGSARVFGKVHITDKEFWRELLIKKATENKQDDLVQLLSSDRTWNVAWGHLVAMDQVGVTIRQDDKTIVSAAKEAGVSIILIAQLAYLLFQVWLAIRREKRNQKGVGEHD